MDNDTQMYFDKVTPSNNLKGFTKSFQKRTKSKKTEDTQILELLSFIKDNEVKFGTKVTEKSFKNNSVNKVFASSSCDVLTLRKIKYYGKISNVEIVELDLDSDELSQKLGKPFLISMVCIGDKKNE